MKFVRFLNEGRTQSISSDEAIRILDKHCKESVNALMEGYYYIERIIEFFYKDYGFIDPSKHPERKSANTSNYYTILVNHLLPSWKKYPKRSIICSSFRSLEDIGLYNYVVFQYVTIIFCFA